MADEIVKVREAVIEDKNDVIRIQDNVYGGMDYLSDYYADFMTCPNTTSYVAIINDKIVGFTSMFLVDDGKTVISRASRVSPSVEGKGVYKFLHNYTLQVTSAERVAFTTNDQNESVKKPSFQQVYTFIDAKPFWAFQVDYDIRSNEINDAGKLHVPNDEELLNYFNSTALKPYLFPKDRIVAEWIPFRLLRSNIGLIKKNRRTRMYSDVMETDDEVQGLLTISTTTKTQSPPYVCHLNVYGTDTDTLHHHVLMHVRSAKEIAGVGSVIKLLVFVEQQFDHELLHKVLPDIGLTKSNAGDGNGMMYSHMLLFEKMIK